MVRGVELGPQEVQLMQWLPLGVDIVIGLDTIMDNGLLVSVRQGQVQVKFHGVAAVAKAEPCDVRASERKVRGRCSRWRMTILRPSLKKGAGQRGGGALTSCRMAQGGVWLPAALHGD